MKTLLQFRAFAVLLACVLVASVGAIDTRIDSGLIRGETLDEETGLRVYRGVPYAEPPLGDLRWKLPRPVAAWSGVRDTTEFSEICMQRRARRGRDDEELVMSEDCLYLNVWTAGKPDQKRPVMVWIHGGGLTNGAGSLPGYDGAEFAKRGVVLVSINYRLGPLGYLALPALSAESKRGSGNYGFHDQIAALQWVRRNIAAFGGDPHNVTIFGESAGATSVYALLTSPQATGLFHRAISESAWVSDTNIALLDEPGPFIDSAEERGKAWVAEALGPDKADDLDALRGLPAERVNAAGFSPTITVDGWFMPERPAELFTKGRYHDVPIIVGTNRNEGTMFLGAFPFEKAGEFERRIHETYKDSGDEVVKLYPVGAESEIKAVLDGFITDAWFLRAGRGMLRGSAKTQSPAYQYHFTRRNPMRPALKAHHAAEIAYAFGNLRGDKLEQVDHELSDAMIRYWVQFATTGDPNVDGLPVWPAWTPGSDIHLELGDEIRTGRELGKIRNDLFDRIVDTAWSDD